MTTLQTALRLAIKHLAEAGCETPRLDAEVICAHLLKQDRSWLYAHNHDVVSFATQQQFQKLIDRRIAHEPVAYILGYREFFGLELMVTPAVLIPRPETELLVELSLEHIGPPQPHIVDVGTGSGCIAMAIAVHRPTARLTAIDRSWAALAVAKQNAHKHSVDAQIHFIQGDLATAIGPGIDVLVSNPPYIAPAEMATLAPEIGQFEPRGALTDEVDGLRLIAKLLADARRVMRPGGLFLLEIGADQGQAVLALARQFCPEVAFQIKTDLTGRDRVLYGQF